MIVSGPNCLVIGGEINWSLRRWGLLR
jgi:hypothetical protein